MIRTLLCIFGWHHWKPSRLYDAEDQCTCCRTFRPNPYGETK